MARRIEIELTSARPDGSWTWRAAGAREPKGVLDGELLPDGTKAGDVVRAEAEFEIDGITIVAVLAPKESTRADPQRIEIIGSGRPEGPGVTTQLVGRGDRRPSGRRRDRDDTRPRRDRDAARPQNGHDGRRPRREGRRPDDDDATDAAATAEGDPGDQAGSDAGRAETEGRDRQDRPSRSRRTERTGPTGPTGRTGSTERTERTEGSDRSGRTQRTEGSDRSGRTERGGRAARGPRPRASGDARPADAPTPAGRQGDRGGRRRERPTPEPEGGTERRARRFNPGRAHRQAVMASLPPEQQPIAEQVLRGGIPAVRTALHLEREKAVAEGRPAPNTDQLVAMAESLLPRLKAAEWRDRAEAAIKEVDEISLRDLRSVVAGADAARDDEGRALAASLREALDRRVDGLRQQWTGEIAKHLDDNRVVRALRLAARPPEPSARMEPELTQRLSDAAGQAMASDTPPDRWLALIDAVSASPVRRSVKPSGLPADPTPELRRAAHQQSGRIPSLAAMLGIAIPPPPAPVPGRRSGSAPRARRSAIGVNDVETSEVETPGGEADPAAEVETSGVEGSGVEGSGVEGSGVEGSGVEGSGVEGSGVEGSGVEGSGVEASGVGASEVGASEVERSEVETSEADVPGRESPPADASTVAAQDSVVAEELGEPIHEG